MKKKTLTYALLAPLAVWIGTLLIVPKLTDAIKKLYCKNIEEISCQNIISTFGATGDMFGAATSLFSGLALFAVAITLWAESSSRKESRKPFLITQLSADSLMLIEPNVTEKKIRLSAKLDIANQVNEAALNVTLKSSLFHNNNREKPTISNLDSPLMGSKSSSVEFTSEITGTNFDSFLAELTAGRPIKLETKVEYQSIEGIKWQTSVTYEIRCIPTNQRNRLNSARGDNEDFEEHWTNNAAVALSPKPIGGTWAHQKM